MEDFRKFDKIARIGTSETAGILDGLVHTFPKLDGTNGSIWIEGGYLRAGSRNRELSLENDNAGFFQHVVNNTELYLPIFLRNPNWIIYGEWLVPHTIKGYQEDAWRKFYVFDVWDGQRYVPYDEWANELTEAGLNVIPCIGRDENPSPEQIDIRMREGIQYLMKDGEKGEGVVLKNYSFVNRFGNKVYAKHINTEFSNRKPTKVSVNLGAEVSLASVVDNALVMKTAEKIKVSLGTDEWDRKGMIPRLIETVYHDVITEKLWDWLKKNKGSQVHFGKLRGVITQQIKTVAPELF